MLINVSNKNTVMNVGSQNRVKSQAMQVDDIITIQQAAPKVMLDDATNTCTYNKIRDCFEKISNINKTIIALTDRLKKVEKRISINELQNKINKHYEQSKHSK